MSERDIVCEDLTLAIDDWRRAGFRLDVIYPADDPRVALLSRADEKVRLAMAGAPPLSSGLPAFAPEFVLTSAGTAQGQGRAGMFYRDLIPGRLGGRYIASHIRIIEGGPVDDWVHFHRVALQLIIVRSGWVRVVYEDQGEPFVMEAGDMVLQPPLIRHRVLESSAGLEVVEITAPAVHETFADHELELPNGRQTERNFAGQRFLRHISKSTPWTPIDGYEAKATAMHDASGGIAEVSTIRPGSCARISFAPHDGELVFGFVLDGTAQLDHDGEFELGPADAFVIPPGNSWGIGKMSSDFRLLNVTTARLDAGV